MLAKVRKLRKELHQYPELSGNETKTADRIQAFIQANHSTRIVRGLGGNGLAAVYEYSNEGPVVMIRCELDALPINEINSFEHRSKIPGVSHKCGHDGHMSIVAGLVLWIKQQTFLKGKIILLFQPAEESGQGAQSVLNDPKFSDLEPDYIFAFHNIPGEPLHSVLLLNHYFSPEVESFAIHLTGKESHACAPENGVNPATAISEMVQQFSQLNKEDVYHEDFALLTPIHLSMGQKAYGISAGSGELHYTIRTWSEHKMKHLKRQIEEISDCVSKAHNLQFSIAWFDYFPAVENDDFCNTIIVKAAEMNGFAVRKKPHPFRFGEDFGWFSKNYKAAMFGIGAGVDSSPLHHAEYDFPDEILGTGITMFKTIIYQLLKETLEL